MTPGRGLVCTVLRWVALLRYGWSRRAGSVDRGCDRGLILANLFLLLGAPSWPTGPTCRSGEGTVGTSTCSTGGVAVAANSVTGYVGTIENCCPEAVVYQAGFV